MDKSTIGGTVSGLIVQAGAIHGDVYHCRAIAAPAGSWRSVLRRLIVDLESVHRDRVRTEPMSDRLWSVAEHFGSVSTAAPERMFLDAVLAYLQPINEIGRTRWRDVCHAYAQLELNWVSD